MKFLRSLVFVLTVTGLVATAEADSGGVSAVRKSSESYADARARVLNLHGLRFNLRLNSAERSKQPMEQLDLEAVPELPSYEVLESEFARIRDERWLPSHEENFPRRPTWLFPDDGCYARAEVASFRLIEAGLPAPKKIFAFGNLIALTDNSPSRQVEWWYHVAVTYRVQDTVYVFDPAIEPLRPLKLREWHDAVGGDNARIKYSICSPYTFSPMNDCQETMALSREEVLLRQRYFFRAEWDRLLELNRIPMKELGDEPPWLNLVPTSALVN